MLSPSSVIKGENIESRTAKKTAEWGSRREKKKKRAPTDGEKDPSSKDQRRDLRPERRSSIVGGGTGKTSTKEKKTSCWDERKVILAERSGEIFITHSNSVAAVRGNAFMGENQRETTDREYRVRRCCLKGKKTPVAISKRGVQI